MRPRRTFNPKRRIQQRPTRPDALQRLQELSQQASYGGNPEHKRDPGDFGLDPPSAPRQGKTLCDAASIKSRAQSLALLQEGIRRGLVSVQERQGWPQNIWAVTDDGIPLEAMLDNPVMGTYHGYPMLDHDPMSDEVLARWRGQ